MENSAGTDQEALYSKIAAKYKESMNDMKGRSPGNAYTTICHTQVTLASYIMQNDSGI